MTDSFEYIARNAKINDIGNAVKLYSTAMNNKDTCITTCATNIRKAARAMSDTAPKQIKNCSKRHIAAYYPYLILLRSVDNVLYLHDDIKPAKIRLRYRVAIRIIALMREQISRASGGHKLKNGSRSNNRTVYMWDLVTYLPEWMDRHKTMPPKLVVEDDFEQTFFHEAMYNQITRNNINLGTKNTQLSNSKKK
eukprot:372919_1